MLVLFLFSFLVLIGTVSWLLLVFLCLRHPGRSALLTGLFHSRKGCCFLGQSLAVHGLTLWFLSLWGGYPVSCFGVYRPCSFRCGHVHSEVVGLISSTWHPLPLCPCTQAGDL